MIDFFFYADIAIHFRTSYINFQGVEVKDGRELAHQYIFHGTFILDILSVFPFEQFPIPDNMVVFTALFAILKVVRIRRLPKLISRLNMKQEAKAKVRMFQMFFFLFLYLHLITCVWWFSVRWNSIWIPPQDVLSEKTDIYTTPDMLMRYFTSFHLAVMCFTGN